MKKILIITNNAFSKTSNNGKTYEAIFSNFDKNNLAQIFFRPQNNTDLEYCGASYMISEIDILNRLFFKTKTCGREINTQLKENIEQQSKAYSKKRGKLRSNPILRDMLWKLGIWKTNDLIEWCKRVNPDIIFFIGGNQSFSYDIANYISDILNIPLAVYYTDDYLINPIQTTLIGKIQKWRIKRYYKKIIHKSVIRFCIGEEMANSYAKYFGKDFYHIMNSIDITPYIEPKFENQEIRIGYFGGLHLDRWNMIARIASLSPENVKTHVYTFTPIEGEIKKLFDSSGIIYHNGIQGEDLKEAMSRCHILLHVESDDKYYRSLTKLSVSTKIPEYLMHGRMIIGYGPTEVASLKLLCDKKLGIVISSDDDESKIRSLLYRCTNNKELIINQGKNGYDYAVKNYNKENIASDFKNKIINIL